MFSSPGLSSSLFLSSNLFLFSSPGLFSSLLLSSSLFLFLFLFTTRQAQTIKQARIVMKLADIDAQVTFIKVWGSESTG